MRKMTVCKKKATTDSGQTLTLVYAVTVDELSADTLDTGIESYGVSIAAEEMGEEVCIRHITHSSAEILTFTERISKNFVTPATLADIVHDWLLR